MKILTKLLTIVLVFSLTSCFDEAEYSDVPEIEFLSLEYRERQNSLDTPALVLEFGFTDGGSDFGIIDDEDIFFPYNKYLVFLDEDDSIISLDNISSVEGDVYLAELIIRNIEIFVLGGQLVYANSDEQLNPVLAYNKQLYDGSVSIEDFECPNLFNQPDNLGRRIYDSNSEVGLRVYYFEESEDGFVTLNDYETRVENDILVQPVETHYNFYITFEEETLDGSFQPVDFRDIFGLESCEVGVFDARIPWFDRDGGESGTIIYDINSSGWELAFQDKLIRIRFQIIDRAGNLSNEVIIDPFRLSDITQ